MEVINPWVQEIIYVLQYFQRKFILGISVVFFWLERKAQTHRKGPRRMNLKNDWQEKKCRYDVWKRKNLYYIFRDMILFEETPKDPTDKVLK